MNIQELKKIGINELIANNVEDAFVKANILLQYILDMNKNEIIINSKQSVNEDKAIMYLLYIKDIINGKPIQYITNNQQFMNLNFYVDEHVLIPQPDTEILVERTLEILNKIIRKRKIDNINNMPINILDLCTGSGAIAVSIANNIEKNKYVNKIKIFASDISEEALKVARQNDILNNKCNNITFIKSDMFENIRDEFDIIVSNPPYIETDVIDKLSKEVQREPHIALDGGIDGLEYYRIIEKESKKYLNKNGYLLLEIGYNQKESVSKIFADYGEVICLKDLAGNDRVIEVRN